MNHSVIYGSTSPVTLYRDWLAMTRFSILACLSFIGCFMAGCVITSIFVQKKLCRLGNSFLGTVALSDIIDCIVYMPISIVVIMSQQGDGYWTCLIQLFIGRTSITYKYIIFMFISLDDFRRLSKKAAQSVFSHSPCSIMTKIMLSLTAAALYSTLSTFGSWGPAFCDRRHQGNQIFEYGAFGFLFIFPTVLSLVIQMLTVIATKKHFKLPKTRRPPIMSREWDLAIINIANFAMLIITTAPSIIVQTFTLDVSDSTFYTLNWLTFVFRSSIYNCIYGIANIEFKNGFAYTIQYCCMKSTVIHNNRHRTERNRRTLAVRFHVMQPERVTVTYIQDSRNSEARIL